VGCIGFPNRGGACGSHRHGVNAWAWAGTINDPILLDSSELKLEWTSTQSGGNVDRGAQVAVGGFYDRASQGATFKLKPRIKVNLTARFSRIYLWIGDGTNAYSQNVLGSMSDDTWYDTYELDYGDVSGWGLNMRYSITARGTDNSNNVGLTKFHIDWIRLNLG
jgi:hypothetical protein